mmetsp:Transcript_6742/g.14732  ORF Transcript_6742/g.14732 Transcript_6742/m.14732 type:complete len:271 (+) Transcript_6742:584-1396(+)
MKRTQLRQRDGANCLGQLKIMVPPVRAFEHFEPDGARLLQQRAWRLLQVRGDGLGVSSEVLLAQFGQDRVSELGEPVLYVPLELGRRHHGRLHVHGETLGHADGAHPRGHHVAQLALGPQHVEGVLRRNLCEHHERGLLLDGRHAQLQVHLNRRVGLGRVGHAHRQSERGVRPRVRWRGGGRDGVRIAVACAGCVVDISIIMVTIIMIIITVISCLSQRLQDPSLRQRDRCLWQRSRRKRLAYVLAKLDGGSRSEISADEEVDQRLATQD